ncbi:glucose/arabinose dehydrogenase [Streptosporangium becharense]|uniref:Glucose/arabinose dehydrogenase n=2 Tax=Streptosporangium becharense TaxID=1816182 RepID=A0A7W9IBA1_9ACTN|nr:PQQ-dependent sugar dehydrogenase [Streptosporangium becharense]MBB2910823.1 glucose/arabinose dehydrogenase [Streptosporangium becharense]MBB5817518.1 glucose/arabinose dehydrogenase [Streptosporangium becharense]
MRNNVSRSDTVTGPAVGPAVAPAVGPAAGAAIASIIAPAAIQAAAPTAAPAARAMASSPPTRTALLTAALVTVLAGCAADPQTGVAVSPGAAVPSPSAPSATVSSPSSPSVAPPSPGAVMSPRASGTPGGTPDLGAAQEVARGIEVPWGLAFLPEGDALVAERDSGRVLRVPARGGQAREVYRVPGVAAGGEGGLLGLAVSPDYAADRYVYAYLTTDSDNRIVRFRLDDRTPEVLFDGIAKAAIHNGGRIAFGPDGMLYAGTGDAGEGDSSQDPARPNGKILRLTPGGDPAPGNPTSGSPVYSLGHRNVQGLAWDGRGRLFATEFGQNRLDEVNLIRPGRNYGWPEVEGGGDTRGGRFTDPLVTWSTSEASPSGAAIAGDTLYVAALRGERLWAVPLRDGATGEPRAELTGRYGRLRTVAVAPDGALWLTTSNTDGRGDVRDGDDRILRYPPRRDAD